MLSYFPLDVLDEIWDAIESFSEEFLTYSYHVLSNTPTRSSQVREGLTRLH